MQLSLDRLNLGPTCKAKNKLRWKENYSVQGLLTQTTCTVFFSTSYRLWLIRKKTFYRHCIAYSTSIDDTAKEQGNFYPKKFYPLWEQNRQCIFSKMLLFLTVTLSVLVIFFLEYLKQGISEKSVPLSMVLPLAYISLMRKW